jgi:hypothetical protein
MPGDWGNFNFSKPRDSSYDRRISKYESYSMWWTHRDVRRGLPALQAGDWRLPIACSIAASDLAGRKQGYDWAKCSAAKSIHGAISCPLSERRGTERSRRICRTVVGFAWLALVRPLKSSAGLDVFIGVGLPRIPARSPTLAAPGASGRISQASVIVLGETAMEEEERCCGSGTCIIDTQGRCWCGQQWDGQKMCVPLELSRPPEDGPLLAAKNSQDKDANR